MELILCGRRFRNTLLALIILLAFSLLSVFVPNIILELHAYSDFEGFVFQFSGNNKFIINMKKSIKNLRLFLLEVFNKFQVFRNFIVSFNIRLTLLRVLVSEVFFLQLFSILCFYFNSGKYKKFKFHVALQ